MGCEARSASLSDSRSHREAVYHSRAPEPAPDNARQQVSHHGENKGLYVVNCHIHPFIKYKFRTISFI